MITLFESENHKNIMFNDLSPGPTVQSNQHLIISDNEAMLLDPGGHKVYQQLFSQISTLLPTNQLKYILFSHQDPDIVASANGWLVVTEAEAFISAVWMRFIPHLGLEELISKRVHPIPDKGMTITLGKTLLKVIPAHFLHSPGNFQVYDPVSEILYSGDLGASLGNDYTFVENFNDHIRYMQGFHKRYIPSSKPLKMWTRMARSLEINIMAPQHGAVFPNSDLVNQFIAWAGTLACGLDLMGDSFPIPE
jgi:flavorubredoxin